MLHFKGALEHEFSVDPRLSFLLAVDAEQVSSLGSEGEDEVGLWSVEPQDCQESLDKTSLTPSEGTEEPGSPAHSTRPHSLSPGGRNCWGQVESEAKATGDATYTSTDREGDQEPLRMYCKLKSKKAFFLFVYFKRLVQNSSSATFV